MILHLVGNLCADHLFDLLVPLGDKVGGIALFDKERAAFGREAGVEAFEDDGSRQLGQTDTEFEV